MAVVRYSVGGMECLSIKIKTGETNECRLSENSVEIAIDKLGRLISDNGAVEGEIICHPQGSG